MNDYKKDRAAALVREIKALYHKQYKRELIASWVSAHKGWRKIVAVRDKVLHKVFGADIGRAAQMTVLLGMFAVPVGLYICMTQGVVSPVAFWGVVGSGVAICRGKTLVEKAAALAERKMDEDLENGKLLARFAAEKNDLFTAMKAKVDVLRLENLAPIFEAAAATVQKQAVPAAASAPKGLTAGR